MTKKKQQKYMKQRICITLLLCIFLTGCNPMSREVETAADWGETLSQLREMSPAELPEHLKVEVSESLMIDADIEIWDELKDFEAGNLLLTQHIFERKDTVDILLNHIGNPEVLGTRERGTESFLDDGRELFLYDADIEDDGWVQARDIYFSVYRMNGRAFNDIIGEYSYSEVKTLNPVEMMSKEQELDFAGREEVLEALNDLFDDLDISMMGENCYACTLENLTNEAELVKEEYEDPVFEEHLARLNLDAEKADEAYILHYRQGYGGIPYCPYSLDVSITESDWYFGAGCKIIYDAQGIIGMNSYSLFDLVEVKSPIRLLSFGEMLEKYVEEQNSASVGKQITLAKAGLYYLPVLIDADRLQYEAKPVWIFLNDDDMERAQMRTICIYDAVTGERLQ